MPQIPYSGVPEVKSNEVSGQQLNLNVSPAMFGMAIGEATKGLGQSVGQLGDVVSRHAIQLQDQQNQIDANNGSVDGMVKIGEETNKLQSMKGNDAVAYLPEYQKNVQKIMADAMSTAPNKAVGLIMQQEMRRQVGYSLIGGARYAATEQKHALTESNKNVAGLAVNTAATTGADEDIAVAEDKAAQIVKDQGLTDQASIDSAKLTARDSVYSQLIDKTGKDNPFQAEAILKKAEGKVSQNTYNKMKTAVDNYVHTVGAKQVADNVTSGGVPKGSVLDVIGVADSGGGANGGYNRVYGGKDDPNLTSMTVREVLQKQKEMRDSGDYRNKDTGQVTSALGKYQIVGTTLQGLVKTGVISPDDKFDALTQDKAATYLFNERIKQGGGDMAKTMTALSQEWDILNKNYAVRQQVADLVKQGGMGMAFLQPMDASSSDADMQKAIASGRQVAANKRPDDPEFQNRVEQEVTNKFNRVRNEQRLAEQEAGRAVTLKLIGGPDLKDEKPKDVAEFIKDPGVKPWWDQLSPTQKDAVEQRIKMNSKGEDVPFDIPARKRFAELHGMSLSGDEEQVKKFLATDMWTEKMPGRQLSQLAQLQNKKRELIEKAYEFPVTRAEKMLDQDGTFKNLGMPEKASPERNIFRSQLQIELSDWQNDHPGKKPNYDEVKQMAARLLAPTDNTLKGNWWPFGSHPAYQDKYQIPAEELAVLMPSLRKQLGRPPTRIEVVDWYEANKSDIKKQMDKTASNEDEE